MTHSTRSTVRRIRSRLADGGLLRKLAGSDTVMVNSLHAQGVAKLAPGVSVEAVADDGLIEAFPVDDAAVSRWPCSGIRNGGS